MFWGAAKFLVFLCIPVSSILLSMDWSGSTGQGLVNFDGSSTVKPLLEDILKSETSSQHINIHNSGTNTGISKMLAGESDFAMSSQDSSYWEKHDDYKDQWTTKKIKTMTLAQDSIVLLYKSPSGCEAELNLDEAKFKTIYSLFTGHKYDDNTLNSYHSLADSQEEACKKPIFSFARNGGHKKSGTAYSFMYSNPLFVKIKNEIETNGPDDKKKWLKKVEQGTAGKDFDSKHIKYTPENNKRSFRSFDLMPNDVNAKMIYLSGSFVFSNWEDISQQGFKIAGFKKDNSTTSNLTKDNFQEEITSDKYTWIRNLNLVYSTKPSTLNDNNKDLLKKIFFNTQKLTSQFVVPIIYKADQTPPSPLNSREKSGADDNFFLP